MNSMERILATLSGKSLDRRAIAPVLSLYGAQLTNCPLEQYYSDAVAYAHGQSAVKEKFQPDVLFSPFDFSSMGAAFGSELHYFADQPPNVKKNVIKSADEWDKIIMPDPDTNLRILYFRKAVQLIAEENHGQTPLAAVLPSPSDLPALIMGLESWIETVLFDGEGSQHVIESIIPFFVRLANKLLEDGAVFIVLPCALASPAIATREITSGFTRAVLDKALSQIKGPVVLHHIGAPILHHIDLLTGLPSVVAFAMDHRDNLNLARQVVGPDVVLLGGPCGPNISRMTVEQVGSECQSFLEDRRSDNHFILFTSGADIPLNTPPENIHAIRKAAESYGRIDV